MMCRKKKCSKPGTQATAAALLVLALVVVVVCFNA